MVQIFDDIDETCVATAIPTKIRRPFVITVFQHQNISVCTCTHTHTHTHTRTHIHTHTHTHTRMHIHTMPNMGIAS